MMSVNGIITLDEFVRTRPQDFAYNNEHLLILMRAITLGAKSIHNDVSRAGITGVTGIAGTENVQGEEQQKLDVIANRIFIENLTSSGIVCAIASEEEDILIQTGNHEGEYVVAMDPLDGSTNIDVNVSIGSIFGVYKRISPKGTPAILDDILRKGTEQVMSCYVLYGTSTMLVYTSGAGSHGFTYDPFVGEFLLTHPNIKTKSTGKMYSCNEGSLNEFGEGLKQYLNYCREQKYKARYTGSLVADFHRNMLKGGIFIYPPVPKHPTGKLRLLYECNPLSFIALQAAGKSTAGSIDVLDIQTTELHQRVPLYVGSAEMIDKLLACLMAEVQA